MGEINLHILKELSDVIDFFKERSFQILNHRYDENIFGNYYIDFGISDKKIRLIKDRGQYFIEQEIDPLIPEVCYENLSSLKEAITRIRL